ncbi:MAG: cytochrome-c peroxidase [Chloroflexi bacterium]|nr:cytochrome-c peroxidase [Chloroflexota bacterium]MBP7041462.1 cytochrome-c peroxidase [Chloroflexota bacterium]
MTWALKALILGTILGGCGPVETVDQQLQAIIAAQDIRPFQPSPPADPALAALGQALFFDKELSGNRDISCATCHHPTLRTGDGLPLSIGTGGQGLGPERELGNGRTLIARNAPDIYNRGSADWQTMFWDGRVAVSVRGYFVSPAGSQLPPGLDNVLAAQAMFPVTSIDEMRGLPGDVDVFGQPNELALIPADKWTAVWQTLMARLLSIPDYAALFQAAYPTIPAADLTFAHAANAIAAFEADAFNQHQSPWYAYLQGDSTALSETEKRGAVLFFGAAGCGQCHNGPLLTDQAYHNLAAPQVGPGKGAEAPLDYGRFRVTGRPEDKFAFRTPSLLNTAVTGPWLHDGAYATLEAVIAHHQNPAAALPAYDAAANLPAYLQTSVQRDPAMHQEMQTAVDPQLAVRRLGPGEIEALVAFLHALTDTAVFDLDHVQPAAVPSGLPVQD